MDWLSFGQAISDLNLELFLTSFLVIVLLILGVVIGRWSLRLELKSTHTNPQDKQRQTWWNNFWQGISTELFGAVITTIGFGLILVVFQQYQTVQSAKADLILQLGSPDNSFAIEAARIALQKGWLKDGSFNNTNLTFANLENANLYEISLNNAKLFGTNFRSSSLGFANLENIITGCASYYNIDNEQCTSFVEVNLFQANLRGAQLGGISFERANLIQANLRGANLSEANLTDANLSGANLQGAILIDAILSNILWNKLELANGEQIATLPDGLKWDSEVDLTRFTDINHPEFQITLEKINGIRMEMGLAPIRRD